MPKAVPHSPGLLPLDTGPGKPRRIPARSITSATRQARWAETKSQKLLHTNLQKGVRSSRRKRQPFIFITATTARPSHASNATLRSRDPCQSSIGPNFHQVATPSRPRLPRGQPPSIKPFSYSFVADFSPPRSLQFPPGVGRPPPIFQGTPSPGPQRPKATTQNAFGPIANRMGRKRFRFSVRTVREQAIPLYSHNYRHDSPNGHARPISSGSRGQGT